MLLERAGSIMCAGLRGVTHFATGIDMRLTQNTSTTSNYEVRGVACWLA